MFDVKDDAAPGKWEYRLKIQDDAVAMGQKLVQLDPENGMFRQLLQSLQAKAEGPGK